MLKHKIMYNIKNLKECRVKQRDTIDLLHNSKYEVRRVEEKNIGRPFDSFGTDPYKKGLTSIYDVFEKMNKTALKLFCMLARVRDPQTNESVLIRKNLTPRDRVTIDRGYKELRDLNLVIRLRDETYLFNPDYLIPNKTKITKIKEKYLEALKEL